MAKVYSYKSENERRIAETDKRSQMFAFLSVASGAGVILFFLDRPAIAACCFVAAIVFLFISVGFKDIQTKVGINGEIFAANELTLLPDTYSIFTNIPVHYQKQNGEIDIVVVGPNGVFAVEVKNYGGDIYGHEKDYNWMTIKRNGERKILKNPVSQVKRQVYLLSNELKRKKIRTWIEPIVFLVNPHSTYNIETSSAVFADAQFLREYIITTNKKPLTPQEYQTICDILIKKQQAMDRALSQKE